MRYSINVFLRIFIPALVASVITAFLPFGWFGFVVFAVLFVAFFFLFKSLCNKQNWLVLNKNQA